MVLAAACNQDISTPFVPGLQPVEPVTVAPPAATATERYPETFNSTRGNAENWQWAQGTGYVHAPIAAVYAALQDAAVVTDRRKVDQYMVMQNVAPEYAHSFRVHNITHDIITVEFDEDWHLGLLAGTDAAPTAVTARYQKVEGTDLISLMEGDIIARVVDANTTRVEMMRHVDSFNHKNGAPEEDQYHHDVFDCIVARVHGRPLPTYN